MTQADSSRQHTWRPSAKLHVLEVRAQVYRFIRHFFFERKVLEVETPIMSQAGNTDPNIASFQLEFGGHVDAGRKQRWLRTSPEYFHKRLLAAGSGDCYELGKVFRNGEAGRRHNPEFTMLEWYRLGWDEQQLIDEVAQLISGILFFVNRYVQLKRTSYQQLYYEAFGFDPHSAQLEQLQRVLEDTHIHPDGLNRDDWLDLIMTHKLQPTFSNQELLAIYDYPASQCALARISQESGDSAPVAKRFEMYLGSVELANGYHELQDAHEQERRFERDAITRKSRNADTPALDTLFLDALQHGLPECAGVALGVDRLLMCLLETDSITDVLSFEFSNA